MELLCFACKKVYWFSFVSSPIPEVFASNPKILNLASSKSAASTPVSFVPIVNIFEPEGAEPWTQPIELSAVSNSV